MPLRIVRLPTSCWIAMTSRRWTWSSRRRCGRSRWRCCSRERAVLTEARRDDGAILLRQFHRRVEPVLIADRLGQRRELGPGMPGDLVIRDRLVLVDALPLSHSPQELL